MKRTPPSVAATAPCLFATWFSAILLAAFLTIISASAAILPPSAEELNAAEKWVVERVTAGKEADLSRQFPEERDRKVSAHFLEDLLTGARPDVTLHRHGVQIKGASIDEPIDLENAQIPGDVRLNCQFNRNVTFAHANFGGALSFVGSRFKDANFNGIKVGGDADFDATEFEGPANFVVADIAGNLQVGANAKFRKSAAFDGMKVRGGAWFTGAMFEGPVSFSFADIGRDLRMAPATFQTKARAFFYGMKVGGDGLFSSTVFEGGVIFDRADIAGIFYPGKEFHGSASFWKLKVGGDARFAGTLFKTVWTSFVEADFAGNLTARNAKFGNKGAYFLRMKVGGDADFDAVEFEGPANFVVADITGNLQVGANAKFREAATFDGMKVRGRARFTGAMFEGPVSFTGTDIAGDFNAGAKFQKGALFLRMKVGGDASFNHASFEGPADLRYAEFSSLDMSGALWPTNPAQFRVQGVSYKTIVAAPKEPKSHEELLKVVSKATYSADVYSRLEEFFLRQGYRADADEAFTAGKVREREEYFCSGDWFGWLRSWMLDLLVGYGRQPWRAGIPCAVLVAVGCVLFSPKKMEPQNPEDTPRVYNRFWYSLGLFLPFVDLQSNKVWKPKADQTFLRNYMRVHILLGWILVPLVLAAVTGLIK
jgi:uncharacterized protein YjbI with pentapeptide repeats